MEKPQYRKLGVKALAELVVIVLGVWIALWADSWASRRKERTTETVGFLGVPSFGAQLGVYDDLKNSGELALLTDAKLRQSLSNMEATLTNVERSQLDMQVVQQLNMDRYMIDKMDLVQLFPAGVRGEWGEQVRSRND